MFTINIKRSAAALAVTAGLFAAAAPASHAFSWSENQTGSHTVKAPVKTSQGFHDLLISSYSVKAKPTKAKHANGRAKASSYARGTQVGSEGVKAPASADHERKDKAVVVLIGANDYGWTEGNDNPVQDCDFC